MLPCTFSMINRSYHLPSIYNVWNLALSLFDDFSNSMYFIYLGR